MRQMHWWMTSWVVAVSSLVATPTATASPPAKSAAAPVNSPAPAQKVSPPARPLPPASAPGQNRLWTGQPIPGQVQLGNLHIPNTTTPSTTPPNTTSNTTAGNTNTATPLKLLRYINVLYEIFNSHRYAIGTGLNPFEHSPTLPRLGLILSFWSLVQGSLGRTKLVEPQLSLGNGGAGALHIN